MRNMRWVLMVLLASAVLAPSAIDAQERGSTRTLSIVRRGWLGISFTRKVETRDGKTTETVTVNEVLEGSPADKAGVREGDEILSIGGKSVTGGRFPMLAGALEPGDTVTLRVSTNGRERELQVIATERPADFEIFSPREMIFLRGNSIRDRSRLFFDSALIRIDSLFADSMFMRKGEFRIMTDRLQGWRFDSIGPNRFHFFADSFPGKGMRIQIEPFREQMLEVWPRFDALMMHAGVAGAEFTAINPGLAQYFGTDKGLLVTRVGPGTPAARAGLESGDVLVKADGRDVDDIEDFRLTVARGTSGMLRLEVIRKGKPRVLELSLPRRRD